MPKLIKNLCMIHRAMIIGGAANPENNEPPRDYDIIIPFSKWKQIMIFIPADATPNSYGGWKFKTEGTEVDIWPGEVDWIMENPLLEWIWIPASNTVFRRYTKNIGK